MEMRVVLSLLKVYAVTPSRQVNFNRRRVTCAARVTAVNLMRVVGWSTALPRASDKAMFQSTFCRVAAWDTSAWRCCVLKKIDKDAPYRWSLLAVLIPAIADEAARGERQRGGLRVRRSRATRRHSAAALPGGHRVGSLSS